MSKFLETIGQLREGFCISELDEALEGVVAAVRSTGKGGGVSLKIKIAPASKKRGSEIVQATADISTSIPVPDAAPSIFFTTEDNDLSRTDPRQMMLDDLRVEQEQDQPTKGD